MLLQTKKEFIICADLKPEDVFFYYTTTSVQYPLACVLRKILNLHIQRLDDVELAGQCFEHGMYAGTVRR